MAQVWRGARRLRTALLAAAMLVIAGVLANIGAALAEEPEWTNETAPGTITFEVDVTYNDGSDEAQEVSDAYEVTVIQVRAWELTDGGDLEVYRRPNSTTNFEATIWNLGNYEDDFELSYQVKGEEGWGAGLPQGWTVQILVDGNAANEVTIGPGASKTVTVRVSADDDRADGELLEVRLSVATPERTPDIEGLEGLPSLPAMNEQSSTMGVKIVKDVLVFLLTPGEPTGTGDTEDLDRSGDPGEFNAYPRDLVPFTGVIRNPSWAEVPVKDGSSVTAAIDVPAGFTLDVDSLELAQDPEDPAYGCTADYDDEERTITIVCANEFPSGGELHIAFNATLDDHAAPTGDGVSYVFAGELTYTDKADQPWTIEAKPVVDGKEPGDEGYPGDPDPEITVLTFRLVKVYRGENDPYAPVDPIPVEDDTNPGKTESYTVYVRNEGNVDDQYALEIISQTLVGGSPKFPWTVECVDENGTGVLAPGAQATCTVSVEIGAGAKDEDDADIVKLQAASKSDAGVLSNVFQITIDVLAPDIAAVLTVWTDAGHTIAADQIKPDDTVYIKAEITNNGRQDATNLKVSHVIPAQIVYAGDAAAEIAGTPVDAGAITDNAGSIEIGPVTLPVGETLTVTYSGEVK